MGLGLSMGNKWFCSPSHSIYPWLSCYCYYNAENRRYTKKNPIFQWDATLIEQIDIIYAHGITFSSNETFLLLMIVFSFKVFLFYEYENGFWIKNKISIVICFEHDWSGSNFTAIVSQLFFSSSIFQWIFRNFSKGE